MPFVRQARRGPAERAGLAKRYGLEVAEIDRVVCE